MFFFKQNTAYEMRISDWSSDVCSSDLGGTGAGAFARRQDQGPQVQGERALSQTDQLQAALALLESIVADRNVLADLPADERTRLLQAVALVHHPEPRARRRDAKAQARERAPEHARNTADLHEQPGLRTRQRKRAVSGQRGQGR